MPRRVLIIDDEPAVCELIERVAAEAGTEVLPLLHGGRASEILSRQKFDLVFLDFRMASPTGLELARQVRGSLSNRSTPIVLISDDQRTAALSIGFEAGATFFLYKPIDKTRLLKLMRAVQGTIENERRRTRRIPLCHKVEVRSPLGDCEGETIDISLNGMLVKSPRIFPQGSPVQLSLQLSNGGQPIRGSGLVARVVGANQMGILVEKMAPQESQRLQDYLLPFVS